MIYRRTVRSRPRGGQAIGDVVATALISELIDPGPELWVVSGWISDVPVIDNSSGEFDHPLDGRSTVWTLASLLAHLSKRGQRLHLALRDDPHNNLFVERLDRLVTEGAYRRYSNPDLHEKILCGSDWLLTGSMNFTWNGLERNEESIEYRVDPTAAAQQLLELHQRWTGVVM